MICFIPNQKLDKSRMSFSALAGVPKKVTRRGIFFHQPHPVKKLYLFAKCVFKNTILLKSKWRVVMLRQTQHTCHSVRK